MGATLFEAGFLEAFQLLMRRYNPMERIGQRDLIPTSMLGALKDVTDAAQQAGVEVIQPLIDAGAADVAISALAAYHMLGEPGAASPSAIQWGALETLEIMLRSPRQAEPIVAKLRSAGVDSFRYLLDHPLVQFVEMELGTAVNATRIAAQVRPSALRFPLFAL